jgi:hypothetical protein
VVRWSDQEDVPREPFRLRPKHALFLVDFLVMALMFVAAGRIYENSRGVKLVAHQEQLREVGRLEGARLIEQADSVAVAAKVNLEEMTKDHDATVAELKRLQGEITAGMARRQELEQAIFRLSDIVLDLRGRTETEVASVQNYKADVDSRSSEIDSLRTTATKSQEALVQTEQERQSVAQTLQNARAQESYDPTGRFPSATGVAVRRDLGTTNDLANLEVDHLFWQPKEDVDMGLSLGVGLGTDKPISNKELGVLLSRSLVHRRLGLDVGAGYSMLTESGGSVEHSPYATAGIRYSPFFKERFHLGAGARATHGELLPYLGLSIGRR